MGKTAYGICMNCGCNKFTVEIYRCDSCRKMYCKKCAHDDVTCLNPECETGNLVHKGYIHPYDKVEETLLA